MPRAKTTTMMTAGPRGRPQRLSRITSGSSTKPSRNASARGIRISRPKYSAAMIMAPVTRPIISLSSGTTVASADSEPDDGSNRAKSDAAPTPDGPAVPLPPR